MIRCEHCGSMLPEGAIFCGECGRSVNVAANRRPAPAARNDQTTPPPLQQPDPQGRRPDPATEAWLPEATLDPATRAWLTGSDPNPPAAPAAPHGVEPRGADPRGADPRGARTHAHGAVSGVHVPATGAPTPQPEPPLDPEQYPSTSVPDGADAEWTRPAAPRERAAEQTDPVDVPEPPAAPVWQPPTQSTPVAPSRPSWWVGRPPAAEETSTDVTDAERTDTAAAQDVSRPQENDTAVVEPLVDRRPSRPTPLVTPGSGPATCHVCGHTLEPDDIFCAECGAVRPAVTAAFTGPVVPLPIARPDWAADDQALVAADAVDDGDQDGRGDDATAADADASDASTADEHGADGDDATEHDTDTNADDDEHAADLNAHGADEHGTGAGALGGAPEAVGHAPLPQVPGSPTVPSAPAAEWTAPPVTNVATTASGAPTAAPLPPVPGTTGPVLPPTGSATAPSSADDLDEDVEATRIVTKDTGRDPFVLHCSTGERVEVHGTGLLGRLPRPQPGERFDDLVTVHDPGKSVSKTHLELGRDGDDLWVSDRFSGNGTVIRHIDGSIRRCEPGRRYRVERGARVDIGEQFFLVQ
ncbi:FHA domain-containing protein [Curtobacterium citreum]